MDLNAVTKGSSWWRNKIIIKFLQKKKKKIIPLVKHIAVEYLIIERAIISGLFKNWRFLLKISRWGILIWWIIKYAKRKSILKIALIGN